jgi:hypothetical protein
MPVPKAVNLKISRATQPPKEDGILWEKSVVGDPMTVLLAHPD